MKTNNKDTTVIPRHIEEERLIAFLDGETETESQHEMQAHLESCWDCRSRLSNVERSIENFLQLRQVQVIPPDLAPSGPSPPLFSARFTTPPTHPPTPPFF